MMEFGLFTVLVGLIGLVSFIWLLVVAFKESILWGILVLLFSPLSAIAFSIYHWDTSKKPFLVYLTTTVIFFAMFFNTFSKMGGMEMLTTTQETAQQLEKGEITEEEAARRVAEQMESNLKRMEEAGLIAMDERRVLEEKIQELKLDESQAESNTGTRTQQATRPQQGAPAENKTTAIAPDSSKAEVEKETNATEKSSTKSSVAMTQQEDYEFGPNWSLEGALEKKRQAYRQQQLDLPTPKLEGEYIPVPVSRAEQFVGREVRVIREKTRHEGLLKAVNDNHIILDMQVSGGQAHFEIKRYEIQSMYLLTLPEDNKSARQ